MHESYLVNFFQQSLPCLRQNIYCVTSHGEIHQQSMLMGGGAVKVTSLRPTLAV